MHISRISVSRAKSYKDCAYYYRLKYHDRVEPPVPPQFHFVYGNILHKIAECHVNSKGLHSLDKIAELVLAGRIPIHDDGTKAPPLPEAFAKRFPNHIESLRWLTPFFGTAGITEHGFKYDLDPPHGKHVVGYIDRLILGLDWAYVLDFKTTKPGPFRETPETIPHCPQLRCYARVVQREFGIPADRITTALYYLDDGLLLEGRYSDESLTAIERELLELYNEIEAADPEKAAGNVGKHCGLCEYSSLCPFFQKSGWNTGDIDFGF